jgi:hypothetical protein
VFCDGVVVALVEGGPGPWVAGGPNLYTQIAPFLPDIERVMDTY